MTEILQNALILITLLQVKHLFADFFLQNSAMLANRERYLHIWRVAHAGIHTIGSAIAFAILGVPLTILVWIVVIEGIVHFHIDWAKGYYSDITGDTPAQPGYWRAFGVDQFLHQVTYVAMIWAWASYTQ